MGLAGEGGRRTGEIGGPMARPIFRSGEQTADDSGGKVTNHEEGDLLHNLRSAGQQACRSFGFLNE